MPADLPIRFGPYVVLGLLGEGGMGVVYRALDPRLEREVAVKVLHRNLEVSGARERFMREARTVSSLNHPNICVIFDVGEQDGDPFLVMELLKGESLKDRIGRGALPADDLREIAFRCALALEAAHAKGVVHRDIKPANIFLVRNEQGAANVKVLDFGLAKLENDSPRRGETQGLTRVGATVGTVEYMSPEQACGEALDARSDLFSLGAVMYEMATGQLPFRGATSAIIFSELLNRDPVPPRSANLHVPADLDRVIRSLLVKNRDARLQSATALLEALTAAPGDEAIQSAGAAARSEPVLPIKRDVSPKPPPPAEPIAGATSASPSRNKPRSAQRPPSRATLLPVSSPGNSRSARTPVPPVAQEAAETRPTAGDSRQVPEPPARTRVSKDPTEHAPLEDPVAGKRSRRTGDLRVSPNRARVSFQVEEQPAAAREPLRARGWLLVSLAALLLAAVAGWLLFRSRGAASAPTGTYKGALQVTPLQNQTGYATLDRAPTELVQLLLAESPLLTVRKPAPADVLDGGTDGTTTQLHAQPEPGITPEPGAVLTGSLSRSNAGYLIHLEVRQVADNTELATAEGTASSLPELATALAEACGQLRMRLGESAASLAENAGDALGDGTANLEALALLAQGDARAETGADAAALALYTEAARIAPGFAAARLRVAETLLQLRAWTEAAAVLEQISASIPMGGPHLRSQREILLALSRSDADALEQAQRWSASRPADAAAKPALAQALLANGRWTEAVTVAERAAAHDPFSLRTQRLLTRAQLAAGRPEAAWKSQTWAFDAGIGAPDLSLAAAVLRGDAASITSSLSQLRSLNPSPQTLLADAAYRANTGDVAGASASLNRAASLASAVDGAASAAAYYRALDSWNRALTGECAGATPGGATGEAAVLLWMTAAWCHTAPPTGAAPAGAVAQAARAWLAGDRAAALRLLDSGPGAGAASAAILRARLQHLSGDRAGAIATMKGIVGGRGAAYLTAGVTYPVALAMLATLYRTAGDQVNSAAALTQLRATWTAGTPEALMRSVQAGDPL